MTTDVGKQRRGAKLPIALSVVVAIPLALFLIEKISEQFAVNWRNHAALPYRIESGLRVAHGSWKRPASLTLICDEKGRLRLLLMTRMPVQGEQKLQIGGEHSAYLSLGRREFSRISVTAVGSGKVDTIISEPASPKMIGGLAQELDRGRKARVGVGGIDEMAAFLQGEGDSAAIRRMATACPTSGREPALPATERRETPL